jgi:chemotaxis protein methyltransferase WspC
LLAEAESLADRGLLDEAAARCERVIARFGPGAPALFLLGMVRQAGGRLDEAEACFRKVIYLDPGHENALMALALIAERRGDSAAADGYHRRARRARTRKGTS